MRYHFQIMGSDSVYRPDDHVSYCKNSDDCSYCKNKEAINGL